MMPRKTARQIRGEQDYQRRLQAAQQAQRQREAKAPAVPARPTAPPAFVPTMFGPTTETLPTGTIKQFPRFTPQQQALQQQFLNQLTP